MNVAGSVVDVLESASDRFGRLDGRFLVAALVLQLGTLAFRSLRLARRPRRGVPGATGPCGLGRRRVRRRRGDERLHAGARRRAREGPDRPHADRRLDRADAGGIPRRRDRRRRAHRQRAPRRALGDGRPPGATGASGHGRGRARRARSRRRGSRHRGGVPSASRADAAAGAPCGPGLRIVRQPGRYACTVLPFQIVAWACRIGVVWLVLAAFGIRTSLATAALVVVLNGASTFVPVPGGAGTQQVLATFALQARSRRRRPSRSRSGSRSASPPSTSRSASPR